jgi:hypothetical protein
VVSQFRAAATTLMAIAVIAICVLYWRAQKKTGRRVLATLGAIFAALLAIVGRINVYELMFHPDSRPSFSAAGASKLDSDEKVIAVRVGGEARAYPVRGISYHHVINDVVGREPIVATY